MGLYLLDKPIGISSNKALSEFKAKHKIAKAGFSGVLDPFASGLLIIATNGHTKLLDIFLNQEKTYTGKILFGKTTNTLDTEGEVTDEKEVTNLSKEQIENAIADKFIGKIMQTPPAFSNIKVDGKRSRDLALKGKDVKLNPKERKIFKFNIISFDNNEAEFEVEVSSGTYIRSLAFDLGKELGYPSMLVELRRTKIGLIEVDNKKINPYDNLDIKTIKINDLISREIIDGKEVTLKEKDFDIIAIARENEYWLKRKGNKYKIHKKLK